MATIRAGNTGVLVIVDTQVGVMGNLWDADRIITNIACAVTRARAQNVPVLWVQHANEEVPAGSPQWQWVPALVPAPDEVIIPKHFNSAFEHTTFDTELAHRGATHIVLAGAATNWCIRATAYGALDRGYDVTLINDAHTTDTIELDTGGTIAAAQIIEELNVVMQWVSYPDRTNGTATAATVNFTIPGGTR